MRHRIWILGLLLGCGGRTPLGGGTAELADAAPTDDAPIVQCTETRPWIVFDATRLQPGGGFLTSLGAMRIDGTERHLLGPSLPTHSSGTSFASFTPNGDAMLFESFVGSYQVHRRTLATGTDVMLFEGEDGTSVGNALQADDGTIAYKNWAHLAIANRDGSGSHDIISRCDACVPVAFSSRGTLLFRASDMSFSETRLDGSKVTPLVVHLGSAIPAVSPDERRIAAYVACGSPKNPAIRILDLVGGGIVDACAGGKSQGTLLAQVGGFGYVNRIAWLEGDWIAFDHDTFISVVAPDRTVKELSPPPDAKFFHPTLAPPCTRIPGGPAF